VVGEVTHERINWQEWLLLAVLAIAAVVSGFAVFLRFLG
jgi:hypothetical protein